MARNASRDHLLVQWMAQYGSGTLPNGMRTGLRETLVDFAAEILSEGKSMREVDLIVARYACLVRWSSEDLGLPEHKSA